MLASHTSKVLPELLVECLMDWNIDKKVSTLTVDNCTTNDVMIDHILDKISCRMLCTYIEFDCEGWFVHNC